MHSKSCFREREKEKRETPLSLLLSDDLTVHWFVRQLSISPSLPTPFDWGSLSLRHCHHNFLNNSVSTTLVNILISGEGSLSPQLAHFNHYRSQLLPTAGRPSLVHTLCAPGHSSRAEQADLSVSLSLTHTMCAPGHSSCAEQADLSFSCTPAAPPNIPDMPTRKQCVLSRVHACMWRVR